MRRLSLLAAILVLTASLHAYAQTYTPKQIRIDAAPGVDTAELLRIVDLPSGVPLTKLQIEAALHRLDDTGMFSDIRYTVNSTALVFTLTGGESMISFPVIYSNFVWWQPSELEKLVEERVPLFHGTLPLTGTLTDQVKTALTALLHDKGIDATVTDLESSDHPGGPITGTALTISSPKIVLEQVHVEGAPASFKGQLAEVQHLMASDDFDRIVATRTIQESLASVFQNAGYLDVTSDAPAFTTPRKITLSGTAAYAIDASTTVHTGNLYHVARVTVSAAPPITQAEAAKAIAIKAGDTASPATLRLARGEVALAYSRRGYLGASVAVETSKDEGAHTVAYTFSTVSGDLYHLASVDTSALPPAQQAAFTKNFHLAPGAVAGDDLNREVAITLGAIHADKSFSVMDKIDSAHHTVTISFQSALHH